MPAPTRYDPSWPRCAFCGVRHPIDNPHLPADEYEVLLNGTAVFVGFREQCVDRARWIAGATVRRRALDRDQKGP